MFDEVVETAFAGTPSRIGGATFADLEAELLRLDEEAGPPGPEEREASWRSDAASSTSGAATTAPSS